MAENTKMKKAADGGPSMRIFFKPNKIETEMVRLVEEPERTVKINKSEYDSAIHMKLKKQRSAKQERRRLTRREDYGQETEDQLLKTTVAVLQTMPEWHDVPPGVKETATKKAEIVLAILAVREED